MNKNEKISAIGFCRKCNKEHFLIEGNSRKKCEELIDNLEKFKRLDFEKNINEADPRFSTDYLFGKARGQMFGVMECLDKNDNVFFIKAFSGQYNSIWEIDGWAPPLLKPDEFDKVVEPDDIEIKKLGKEIAAITEKNDFKKRLIKERKILSQNLLNKIYSLYEIYTFKGETKSLFDVFPTSGIPTGTGDCCAPKLINYAAKNKLRPVSLAEFYFGKENLSGTKKHKEFYSSCSDKCYPILGEMMCGGINEK